MMKALVFESYGPPSVLSFESREIPAPKAGEVLVKVAASAINPSDVKNVAGHFKAPRPRVPGRDYAGVIVAGDGPIGAAVWGSGPGFGVARDGAHQEYFVMPASWIALKPPKLGVEEAASIGVPYLAAWSALISAAKLKPGETVLVTGVSGAVGRAATQIAHWKKAKVIGVSRSSENPSGADAVIDTTRSELPSAVRALTGGRGVDVVLDAVGGLLFEPCLNSLAAGGRQVVIASNPPVVTFNVVDFYHGAKHLIGADTMRLSGEEIGSLMNTLQAGFEAGHLHPPAVRTWPVTQAVAAYQSVAKGTGPLKQVLRFE